MKHSASGTEACNPTTREAWLGTNGTLATSPHQCVLALSIVPPTILSLALRIETNRYLVERWFHEDPIYPLGGHTAEMLVAAGHVGAVAEFLNNIGGMDA
jgi:hypothetical protein